MQAVKEVYQNETISKARLFLISRGVKPTKQKKIAAIFRQVAEEYYGLESQHITIREVMCIALHRWLEAEVDTKDYFQAAMDTANAEYKMLMLENKKRMKANKALRKAMQRKDILEYRKSAAYKMRKWSAQRFYNSQEWKAIRYNAIERCNGRCQACGRTVADGIILHVDHIKPRSVYPELALTKTNLQVLCDICNLGKVNKYATNWMERNEIMRGGK